MPSSLSVNRLATRRRSLTVPTLGKMPSLAHPLQAGCLLGHTSFVEGVEFSANGKYIMSSSSGKFASVYGRTRNFAKKEEKKLRYFSMILIAGNSVRLIGVVSLSFFFVMGGHSLLFVDQTVELSFALFVRSLVKRKSKRG